jgi:histidyl-tRNA synthetase
VDNRTTIPGVAGDGWHSRGMRDLGPAEMRAFRRVERCFLESLDPRGFAEIRTPTVEPLHLYTATGALAPELLDRVYSFLDWDGWSGERVVLRPDATVPAARWYEQLPDGAPARLCYVQPVFRFAAEGPRELWQCGAELFGLAAPEGDAELLAAAVAFVRALGLGAVRAELGHAGVVRAALAATGLDQAEQLAAYDRLLGGDVDVTGELAARAPALAPALRLLFEVQGDAAYLANLRAALVPAAPGAAEALAEVEAAARALAASGVPSLVTWGATGSVEYYTGLTFRLLADGAECLRGGRYDGLGEALDGRRAPACGFGGDVLRLAALADSGAAQS